MKQEYYITDLGIVIKDDCSIRLKSTYKKEIISEEDFNNSNPIRINKGKYLEKLNKFFRDSKYEWEYKGTKFKKLNNFSINSSLDEIPRHKDIIPRVIESAFIVMYQGRIYYTFVSGNYYPQMQLIDFHTKSLTGKWTNIKNLAPVFNKTKKEII